MSCQNSSVCTSMISSSSARTIGMLAFSSSAPAIWRTSSLHRVNDRSWRNKPSWALVSGNDQAINPDLERWYAKRAKSHTVEVAGSSHAVYVSHPKEVAALIEDAATHAH